MSDLLNLKLSTEGFARHGIRGQGIKHGFLQMKLLWNDIFGIGFSVGKMMSMKFPLPLLYSHGNGKIRKKFLPNWQKLYN